MATKTDGETDGYTFRWKIENISYCWLKTGQHTESPTFIPDALKYTKWSLWLYPMGSRHENDVGIFLHRERDGRGPDGIQVNFQLAFLDKDGSILKKETTLDRNFRKGDTLGNRTFEIREKVFATERETFLPNDTLTVQCTLWKNEDTPVHPKHFYARTIFKENRRSFVWTIDKFRSHKYGVRKEFKDGLINFELGLNEEIDFEKKLVININSFDEGVKYFSLQICVIDSEGKRENCGIHEYFADDLKKGVLSTRLFTRKLIENKSRYLPIDVLSLVCEYVISSKIVLFEFVGSGILFPKLTDDVGKSRNDHTVEKEKSQNTSVLANDLKPMYTDAILCDTELRTSMRTFSAHKTILSARSPVFRRMFSNDMKEKNSGHVDITDLEDDTVHRMLLYIYTDSLENLQLESASKLYAAADKYEIMSLRSRCSSFLKDNLCPTKVYDVLVLADLHQDNDLKSFLKDYVLEHDKEIFGCQEWKDFMCTNLKLAADIMYWKVFPG